MASAALAITLSGLLVLAPASPSSSAAAEASRTAPGESETEGAPEPPPANPDAAKPKSPAKPDASAKPPETSDATSKLPSNPDAAAPKPPANSDATPKPPENVDAAPPPVDSDAAPVDETSDPETSDAASAGTDDAIAPLQVRAADVTLSPDAPLPLGTAASPERTAPTSAPPSDFGPDPHRRFLLAGGISSLLVGVGLGVVGFYGLSEVRKADRALDRERAETTPDAMRIADLEDERDRWRTAGLATGIVGAALAVTGLTLTGLGVVRAPVRVAPTAQRGRMGLELTGRF